MFMVICGIFLFKVKCNYMVVDVKCEVEKNYMFFGKICDFFGDGIDNVMVLFYFVQQYSLEQEFIVLVLSGIWFEGLDINNMIYFRKMVEWVELDWE